MEEGKSFAVGLGQVHRQHFDASDPRQVAEMFEPCHNLKRSAEELRRCYGQARPVSSSDQEAIRKAYSCYYSGNFTTGFRPEPEFGGTSHVQRVLANADLPAYVPALQAQPPAAPTLPAGPANVPVAPSRLTRAGMCFGSTPVMTRRRQVSRRHNHNPWKTRIER